MKRMMLCMLAGLMAAGCSSRTFSSTPRTAIEMLLLSTAVDRTMDRLTMPELAGEKVYIDFANLTSYDVEYVKVALRTQTARQGATLVASPEAATLVMEVASGGHAMEYKSSLIGLPQLPVPKAEVPLPEMPLYRKIEQTAIMKLLVFVHRKGEFVSSLLVHAKADRDESFLLGYRYQTADDIRSGWERADADLRESAVPQQGQGEPSRPAP